MLDITADPPYMSRETGSHKQGSFEVLDKTWVELRGTSPEALHTGS